MLRNDVHEAIDEARRDLAAAFRLAARHDLHEGVCNHFSAVVGGTTDLFLLNPPNVHWSLLRASDLLLIDGSGRVVEGAMDPEPTSFYIHSLIHRSNPNAACVMHTHMPYATAITTIHGGRLEPISQTALRLYAQTAYDESYNGLALDETEGGRISAALGDKQVLFLANHGVIVTGPTVAHAFGYLYYLERACQLQWLAYQSGKTLRRIDGDIIARTVQQLDDDHEQYADVHFAAWRRLLDRDEPDYVD
jgi:ribulose-5-phosphate 4-epimerase/fuculose-1-phosphate aldolase